MEKYKFEVYLPEDYLFKLIEQLNKANILQVNNYDYVTSYTKVKGTYRPLQAANPFAGEINQINYGEEIKLEFSCAKQQVKQAIKIIDEIHPYEEPVFNIIALSNHLFQ